MTATTEMNIALLCTAFQAVEGGDLDAAEGMLTEDFIASLAGSPESLRGREVWRLGAQSMLESSLT